MARIGYGGPYVSTLGTLRAIHMQHPQAIPFENLNPFLRWPVSLDLPSIQQKLIRDGRGGYCYEHNLLLSAALRAIGFEVRWLAARVISVGGAAGTDARDRAVNPRTHMLLRVDVEGKSFIADVGFGGLTLTAPLRLEPGLVQETPHERFRVTRTGDTFVLEAEVVSEWRALYRFDEQEQVLADYEMANWYLSNNPASHFVTGLVAARVAPGIRYALRGNQLAEHRVGTASAHRTLASPRELRAALIDLFHIRLPETRALDAALARVASGPG